MTIRIRTLPADRTQETEADEVVDVGPADARPQRGLVRAQRHMSVRGNLVPGRPMSSAASGGLPLSKPEKPISRLEG
ncbi:hypothetical protein [Streptomyces sp. NPDC054865]